jgi:hypothetical protein
MTEMKCPKYSEHLESVELHEDIDANIFVCLKYEVIWRIRDISMYRDLYKYLKNAREKCENKRNDIYG